MQKMNSLPSYYSTLACVAQRGAHWQLSVLALALLSALPITTKVILKLCLNFSWQDSVLLPFSQGRIVTSLGNSRSPHHKAKTSISTGHKASRQSPLSSHLLTLSPHGTLSYFGHVQPEESSSPPAAEFRVWKWGGRMKEKRLWW